MVHVKQYARNEMNDGIIKGRARWKNRYIPEDTNYWDLPWEKERLIEWKRNLLMTYGKRELYNDAEITQVRLLQSFTQRLRTNHPQSL